MSVTYTGGGGFGGSSGGGYLSNIFIPFGSATLVNVDPTAQWYTITGTNQYFNVRWYLTVPSVGDEFHFNVPLKAGTYDVTFFYERNVNLGMVDLYFNDTIVGSLDFYYSYFVIPAKYEFSASVASDSDVSLKVVVTGKNASSSDYKIVATGFLIGKR